VNYWTWIWIGTWFIVRSRKLRLTTVGDASRWPRDTPLSAKVGTKFRQQVAVAQSVWFACGLQASEFVFLDLFPLTLQPRRFITTWAVSPEHWQPLESTSAPSEPFWTVLRLLLVYLTLIKKACFSPTQKGLPLLTVTSVRYRGHSLQQAALATEVHWWHRNPGNCRGALPRTRVYLRSLRTCHIAPSLRQFVPNILTAIAVSSFSTWPLAMLSCFWGLAAVTLPQLPLLPPYESRREEFSFRISPGTLALFNMSLISSALPAICRRTSN
jgi:hypothetical protein